MQNSEDASLGLSLLGNLKAAANVMIITATNVVEVIQTLSKVTQLKEEFNSTQIDQIFDLELKFASRVSGSAMTITTAGTFVKALGDILDPSFLDYIIEEDFGAFPQAGNQTYSLETKNFTTALSQKFDQIKVEVGNALLKTQIEGEASVKISAGGNSGVSMSAQKQKAENIGNTLKEFSGAEFNMPDDILGAIGETGGGVQIFVGYTGLVWPGDVPDVGSSLNESLVNVTLGNVTSTTTFGKGVHSLSLGKSDGSGLHSVKNLTTPVVMMFEVALPELNTTGITGNETLTRTPQCLYWDIDAGVWSTDGCELTFFNGTHMECTCNHLTDFGTAFTDVAGSLNFEVFVNVDVLLDDLAQKIIDNPGAFILLFATYFFCGIACIGGSIKDGNDIGFTVYKKSVNEFESYKEASAKIAVPRKRRMMRTVFLLVNLALVVLTITDFIICIVSWTSNSVFNVVSRGIGIYLLFMFTVFQGAAVLVGFQIGGFWRSPGKHKTFFAIFIAMTMINLAVNAFAIDFAASFSGSGIGWGDANWFMKAMWKSLSTEDQEHLQKEMMCCGFDATFFEEEGLVEPVCPIDPLTGEITTSYCLPKLEENISDTVQLMATMQLLCTVLLIPLGVASYISWQAIRMKQLAMDEFADQDKYIDVLGKPPLAPPKQRELDKAKLLKDAEMAKEKAEGAAKPKSFTDKVKNNLYICWEELKDNHHILEVILSTKVDFPRRDRALCFLSYTLMMFVTSGLSYNVDFAGTSCCVDDEDYAPVNDIQEPYAWDPLGVPTKFNTKSVTQSCAWWFNTTIAQNATLCKSNYYASEFTEDQNLALLDACPSSCGGCTEISRLVVSCRIALTLINFLIALPPSLVLAATFTNVFKIDRLNDGRWDAVVPNVINIRKQVKALRGYFRKYTQLNSWDKANIIVDVLFCIEDWSKAATITLLSIESEAHEKEVSLLWLNYISGHLNQLVDAIEKGHLNAAAEQMEFILSFEKADEEEAVVKAATAFLAGDGKISGGAMSRLRSKAKNAKKDAMRNEIENEGENEVESEVKQESPKKSGWGGFLKKGKVYISGNDSESPSNSRPKTPQGQLEKINWSSQQEKESTEAMERIKKLLDFGAAGRKRRRLKAKWGLRFAYATLVIYILLCTWYIVLFALTTGLEDGCDPNFEGVYATRDMVNIYPSGAVPGGVQAAECLRLPNAVFERETGICTCSTFGDTEIGTKKTNDWLVSTVWNWCITFFVWEPGTIIMKALVLAVILKELEGTRLALAIGSMVEIMGAFMGGGIDNVGNAGGDILAAGGAGEVDDEKATGKPSKETISDVDDLVMLVFSGNHKNFNRKAGDKPKKEKQKKSLITGKKYQVAVTSTNGDDKEEEKTDEPAMHFDVNAEAQVAILTPRRDTAPAQAIAAKEGRAKGPPAALFGPGAGAVDAITGASYDPLTAPTMDLHVKHAENDPVIPFQDTKRIDGSNQVAMEKNQAKPASGGPPTSARSGPSVEAVAKFPASRGPPANLMASMASSTETKKTAAAKGPPSNLMSKGPPVGLMKNTGAKPSSSTAAPKVKGPSVNLMKSAMAKKQASPNTKKD
jgi:hypothetical protein